jgi:hypothetical protein
MRVFNSLQIVLAYAATPFGIAWLSGQDFRLSGVALIAACTGYVVFTGAMVAAVYCGIGEWEK